MSMDYSTTVTIQPTGPTEIRGRGYLYGPDRVAWASVDIGKVATISQRAEDFDALLRVADAIRDAVAQARQLQQDATVPA